MGKLTGEQWAKCKLLGVVVHNWGSGFSVSRLNTATNRSEFLVFKHDSTNLGISPLTPFTDIDVLLQAAADPEKYGVVWGR
jgi:hypothetical protein